MKSGNASQHIGHLLDLGHTGDEHLPAIVFENTVMCRGDLDRQSSQYAAALLHLGLEPGDRIASLLPNCIEYFVHFLGCLKAGLVPVALDFRAQIEEIEACVEEFEPALLFSCASRLADIEACYNSETIGRGVLEIGAPPNAPFRYEDLISGSQKHADLWTLKAKDPGFILLVNSRPDRPGGIVHNHDSIATMILRSTKTLRLVAEDSLLIGTPLANLSAIQSCLAALSARVPIILPHSGSVQDLTPAIRAHSPTILQISSNALFNLVLDGRFSPGQATKMRLFVSGSNHLHREALESVTELLGLEINETFGFAETGQIATIRHASSHKTLATRQVLKSGDTTVEQVEFDPPAFAVNDWNSSGYDDRSEANALSGVYSLSSGPLGSDIESRQEVENALGAYPGVDLVGLGRIPDSFHGHELVAYVVPNDWDYPPPTSEIIQYARNRVGRKAPDTVQYVDIVPLTDSGKIDPVLLAKTGKSATHMLSESLSARHLKN